ncbi:hypothetical protein OOU_Y34scaffold00487g32 [Pyricularia oryzae Y34]|uniref:Uncharacterized protein n=2 Tax=Pyricularia oryzae TaxID=318829 RepID=A0AA97P0U1_PYRO3|nr:hypothetical protein OOU_Y34scaffold00487g32 [Pyricularia oryzae Y34]
MVQRNYSTKCRPLVGLGAANPRAGWQNDCKKHL